MPRKLDPNAPKKPPGRPGNSEKSVEISLKVRPVFAKFLADLGERYGWGTGHTEVARFLLTREVARLQERDGDR